MKTINIKNTICNCDFIVINENNDILLFNHYNNSKIKKVFNDKIFNNTSVKNDIYTINNILNNYGIECVETRKFDNVYIYDIVSNRDIKDVKDIEKEKEDIIKTFDYDFILHNKNNGTINLLKYNNHKRIKKDIKEIVNKSSSISFLNIMLHKHNLKCFLLVEENNVNYYEIISFTEYNKRNKMNNTLDLSDLD